MIFREVLPAGCCGIVGFPVDMTVLIISASVDVPPPEEKYNKIKDIKTLNQPRLKNAVRNNGKDRKHYYNNQI
jgi:hypothetical protein